MHVVILTHARTPLASRHYFLRAVADVWREDGLRVTAVTDPDARVEADLAILHVDLTVVPEAHLAFARRYPVTLNARVADISKRRISAHLVRPGDGYEGPVVVKTDRNCGGTPEDRVAARGSRLRRAARALRGTLPWSLRGRIPTAEYRVFDAVRDVPWPVWRNRDLVVERFLPERDDGLYRLRTWIFLGDRESNSICWSPQPIVKSESVVRREPAPGVPEDLRALRRDLGFDFGKFDYAIVDGRTVLYDANRTPTVGAFPHVRCTPQIRHLAAGIRSFQ